MKKILTKTLSLVICIGFLGTQSSLAAVLTTGDFAGRQVLNGTGAVIKGHTAGLRNVETDLTNATLHFQNHTRIDWDKLNVDKGQSLYFKNGTYGVLNNVVGTSISKFAGLIKSDNGKVIISNPNGMLFNGGQFNGGSLLLTTKDLTADTYGEGYDYSNLTISDANNGAGSNYGVIAIIGNSEISSPDISIVANGVYFDNSTLSSPSANGVVLVTADGANFVANKQVNFGEVSFTSNQSSSDAQNNIYVANSAITTQNGEIKFTTGVGATLKDNNIEADKISIAAKDGINIENTKFDGDLTTTSQNATRITYFHNSEVTGNADMSGDAVMLDSGNNKIGGNLKITDANDNDRDVYGARIYNTEIGGKLDVDAQDIVRVKYSKANTTSSTANTDEDKSTVTGSTVYFVSSELGKTDINATKGMVDFRGANKFNGDLKMQSSEENLARVVIGDYDSNGNMLTEGESLTVNGNLDVTAGHTVCFSADITADNISLTATKGSVVQSEGYGSLNSRTNNISLSADTGAVIALKSQPVDNYVSPTNSNDVRAHGSDYIDATRFGYEAGLETSEIKLSATDSTSTLNANIVAGTEGKIHTDAANMDATVAGGEITIVADNNVTVDSTGTNTLKVDTGKEAVIKGNAGTLIATSDDADSIIRLDGMNVTGNANISADAAMLDKNPNTIGGNLKIVDINDNTNDAYGARVWNTKIDGSLDVDSYDIVRVKNSQAGQTDIIGSTVYLSSVELGDTNVESTKGMIEVIGKSVVNGDMTLKSAHAADDNSTVGARIAFGDYNTSTGVMKTENETLTVTGVLDATAGDTLCFSNDITAKEIKFTASEGSIVQANGYGGLISDKITLIADGAEAVALDAQPVADYVSPTLGTSIGNANDYIDARRYGYRGGSANTDFIDVSTQTPNADMDLNIGASISKIHSTADNTVATAVPNTTLNNTELKTDGKADVKNFTLVKKANDTDNSTGNIVVTSDGDVTIGDVTAETNIEVYAADSNISVVSDLKADYDVANSKLVENMVGDVILRGKTLVGENFSTTESTVSIKGANVELTQSTPVDTLNLSNITALAPGNDEAGDIDINVPVQNVNLKNLHATRDITIDNGTVDGILETANLQDVIADSEINGIGDLNIKTRKDINANTIGGANIYLTSTEGNINVDGAKAYRGDQGDDKGNITITANSEDAKITVANVEAETYITGTAQNGTIDVKGNLSADYRNVAGEDEVIAENGIGDVILTAKKLDGKNFNTTDSDVIIKGSNVTLTQTTPREDNTVVLSGVKAIGLDDEHGDLTITIQDADTVNVANIEATHDINIVNDVNTNPQDVVFEKTITLKNVYADSEFNGRGDINLKAKGDIKAENIGGGNIILESTESNIDVKGAKSQRVADNETASAQASIAGNDEKSGNIVLTADKGDIKIADLNAGSDIIGTAENGTIHVVGNIAADAEDAIQPEDVNSNTYGSVILSGKLLRGTDDATLGSTGAIKGANVILTQELTDEPLYVSNVTASAVGNDENGDVIINIPTNNINLTNIKATRDIVANNGSEDGMFDTATLKNVVADSEENGIGDLNIRTRGKIDATDIGGANITLESTEGDIVVNGAVSRRGNQPDYDTADGTRGAGNVTLIADNGDITLGNISADTDIVGDASNGNINQTGDLVADATDKNGIGTVRLTAKDGLTVGENGKIQGGDIELEVKTGDINAKNLIADGQGSDEHGDITIHTPKGNLVIDDTHGTHDVTIITDKGKATVTNTEADSEKNGQGTLTIIATDDVVADNDRGANVTIESKNGDVDASNITADGDDQLDEQNGDGNIKITAKNGDVDITDFEATNNVIVKVGKDSYITYDNITADSDRNTVGKFIIDRDGKRKFPDIDDDEASRLLNNLIQQGIDTNTASSFTPIAFAADDDDESEVLKRIVKTVFKTPETGIVTITDRYKSMK